jgi:hypothetical protein
LQDDRAYALWAISRPLFIAGAVLGFMIWWPIGCALLFLAVWNRRLGRLLFGAEAGGFQRFGCGGGWERPRGFERRGGRPSGNAAFDDYRASTLRRLEEEQAEFATFLERLRFAKDKSEFDQFMNERRGRPPAPPPEPPSPGQA